MRTKSRVLAAVVVAVLAPLGLGVPAQAGSDGAVPEAERYCVVVLGKASTTDGVSPELYKHCSATPFDADVHLRSTQAQTRFERSSQPRASASEAPSTLAAAAQVHLIRAYTDANFKGTWWDYYGAEDCDQYGYQWIPSDWWKVRLSSIWRDGTCSRVRLHTRDGQQWQEFGLSLSNFGTTYNDNVGRTHIWAG
jgi:hypothetical protein